MLVNFWSAVPGYEGIYEINSDGDVRNMKGLIISPAIGGRGYMKINLSKGGVSKCNMVHNLVARAWVPNPDNKPQVNHKDGNKLNNAAENLEWCTQSENIKHAYQTGLERKLQGHEVHTAKLTPDQVRHIRSSNMPKKELAKFYGVWETTIRDVLNGVSYKNVV